MYKNCINELKKDKDYLYAKKEKSTSITNALEGSCSVNVQRFDLFSESSVKLIDSVASKDNSDFIIINRALRSLSNAQPSLTILKFKGQDKYYTIHKYYVYNDNNKDYIVSDGELVEYKPKNNFDLLENYVYKNLLTDKISKFPSKKLKYYKQMIQYFIIARISGKLIIKKIYFADDYGY
ncbi:hypothetical protein SAMN05421856_1233 [Chryseobacterium taichungense]|uniref:Uncharacterized protein n=2 Tax=Chryseobacterium taichungense TaxID=295069 RepID=A0A1H8E0C0_9FLAO|nr:hypothetical protein SAMN05421856_1233 [Chryseobacterium taichungense]